MEQKPIYFSSITELAQAVNFQNLEHPSIVIFDLEVIKNIPDHMCRRPVCFNFYTIGLKKNLDNAYCYGRTKYDFNKGVLGFTSPNQVIEIDNNLGPEAKGWMILVHKEFLINHPLHSKIEKYGFFSYEVNEALHMSKNEEKIINKIFIDLLEEYRHSIDNYSQEVMLSYLELLLSYSNRFYNRQFITRHQSGTGLLDQFEALMYDFFQNENFHEGLPHVGYFAKKLNISSNYLSDYLRSNTGKSTQDHIHLKIIEKAKGLLLSTNKSISEIAYGLGFEYPQYFSRLFAQKAGCSPKEFRMGKN